jgi:hypothetical protein
LKTFKKNGYPEILINETSFDIKAIDYWEFRSFNFNEVKSIDIINPQSTWYNRLYFVLSLTARIFAKDDPLLLRIIKKNEGVWEYNFKSEYNLEFRNTIKFIKEQLSK